MARKLVCKKGSRIYAQRKATMEPVNGQMKEGRGLRLFLLRGLETFDAKWHLMAATHTQPVAVVPVSAIAVGNGSSKGGHVNPVNASQGGMR